MICGKIAAIAQVCPCGTKFPAGVSHHFGGALTVLKRYHATWDISAIASQYRAICGHLVTKTPTSQNSIFQCGVVYLTSLFCLDIIFPVELP